MANNKIIKLVTHNRIEEFNAADYWNEGEPLEFVAVGFNFSLEDINKIREDFEKNFAIVVGLELNILQQILTVRFN